MIFHYNWPPKSLSHEPNDDKPRHVGYCLNCLGPYPSLSIGLFLSIVQAKIVISRLAANGKDNMGASLKEWTGRVTIFHVDKNFSMLNKI